MKSYFSGRASSELELLNYESAIKMEECRHFVVGIHERPHLWPDVRVTLFGVRLATSG